MPALPNRSLFIRLLLSLSLLAAALATALPAEAGTHSLTGPLPDTASAPNFVISPDSHWVAFVTDKDTDDVNELYVVPITGTTPIKLNPPLVAGGNVEPFSFTFTPDSQSVLYLADQAVDNRVDLYSVSVHGGSPILLSGSLISGGNVTSFRVDAATGRVVFVADKQTNEVFELWSAFLSGGGIMRLSGDLTSGGDVGIFDIDTLSHRVIYSADAEINNTYELYSVSISGSTPVKLNPTLQLQGGGDSGLYSDWAIDQVNNRVVFIARESSAHGGNLYAIASNGGVLKKISFNLLSTQRLLSFKISPTGNRVVFNVGNNMGGTFAFKGNLYSNDMMSAGAANVTQTADPLFGTNNYQILPDGSGVVYTFQNDMTTTQRLEGATMSGVRSTLYTNGAPGTELFSFQLSADSQWVAYQTGSTFLAHAMYAVPPTGGSATGFGQGDLALITPNSGRLLYLRRTDADSHNDLFSQQIFGGAERNLTHAFPAAYMLDVEASPDGNWFVYQTQIDGHYELRVTDGNEAVAPTFLPMTRR